MPSSYIMRYNKSGNYSTRWQGLVDNTYFVTTQLTINAKELPSTPNWPFSGRLKDFLRCDLRQNNRCTKKPNWNACRQRILLILPIVSRLVYWGSRLIYKWHTTNYEEFSLNNGFLSKINKSQHVNKIYTKNPRLGYFYYHKK